MFREFFVDFHLSSNNAVCSLHVGFRKICSSVSVLKCPTFYYSCKFGFIVSIATFEATRTSLVFVRQYYRLNDHELREPAGFKARRRLRSASSSSSLVIRRTRLSTVGDRAFSIAAARVWNSLPQHVTSTQSLPVFHSRLKTHLFRRCFP